MARSNKKEPVSQVPELKLSRDEATAKLNERIQKGRQLRERRPATMPDLDAFESDYKKWNSYNTELLKQLFTTESFAEEYSWWGAVAIRGRRPTPEERVRDVEQEYDEKLQRLESIVERLELIPVGSGVTAPK